MVTFGVKVIAIDMVPTWPLIYWSLRHEMFCPLMLKNKEVRSSLGSVFLNIFLHRNVYYEVIVKRTNSCGLFLWVIFFLVWRSIPHKNQKIFRSHSVSQSERANLYPSISDRNSLQPYHFGRDMPIKFTKESTRGGVGICYTEDPCKR